MKKFGKDAALSVGGNFAVLQFGRFTLAENAIAMTNSLRKSAFTLAEVLVTLGIIGVVSAMTVPSLMQNYQRQSYVTQLHKVYNEFSQAFMSQVNDRNALNLKEAGMYVSDDYTFESTFLKKYLKVVNDCKDTTTPCFASDYKTMSGKSVPLGDCGYSVTLASGASVCMLVDGIDSNTVTDDFAGTLLVDINGQKGPNIWGRDLFNLYIFADGAIDDYYVNIDCRLNNNCDQGDNATELRDFNYTNYCNTSGDGCFGKILNDNWQMTY